MRRIVEDVTCDLCGLNSPLLDASWFTAVGDFDYCRDCGSTRSVEVESGGHRVVLSGESWLCSCGTTMQQAVGRLRLLGTTQRAMDAAPNLACATAHAHVGKRC